MRLLRAARAFLALALAAAAGCSLAIDASDIDAGCKEGEKLCSGKCVDIEDPAYGCTPQSCLSCGLLNAIPTCENNECVPLVCLYGYCGPNCQFNVLVDEDNCGACGNACAPGETCEAGTCVTSSS